MTTKVKGFIIYQYPIFEIESPGKFQNFQGLFLPCFYLLFMRIFQNEFERSGIYQFFLRNSIAF